MQHTPRFRRIAIAIGLAGALGAVTAFGVAPIDDAEPPPVERVIDTLPLSLQFPESLDRFTQIETIRRGDTLAALIARAGASDAEFLRFAASDRIGRQALQMRVGRNVRIETDGLGRVISFSYRLGGLEEDGGSSLETRPLTRIEIHRESDRLVASEAVIPIERSVEKRSIEIRSSLFGATDAAGIPESVAIRVANIFSGDIDFTRDLRQGDRLRVAYELVRETGTLSPPEAGRVLAVELINDGKRHEAFWFERGGRGEYFTFDGKSLRKAFLRNPLEFSRITSGFSNARRHPIHNDWRAHKGVDFGAPTGTPVRATADGIVDFVGQQRGYGNMIVIRHKAPHTSVYAHLSGFATGLKRGQSVAQGQVIGRVGATGWATGPHLHYELRVNGQQVNPMRAALPDGKPLNDADRAKLAARVGDLREQFAQLDTFRLASFE